LNSREDTRYIPELTSDEVNYFVALNGSESFKRNFKTLLDHFKSFRKIYFSTEDDFRGIPGLGSQTVTALAKIKELFKPGLGMDRIQGKEIRILTFWDTDYPSCLKEVQSPPPLLYVKGNISYDFSLSIGIVGTRQANRYGREQAFRFARDLASLGFTVISGGASGIDSEAHKGVIEAHGKTFAVFGSGIDVIFPAHHKDLFNSISQKGALISEFPPGIAPEPFRFPIRNRIIAGLSRNTMVIQAPVKSGALITCNYALELGREVMALPGRIDDPAAQGTNLLIRDGARIILDIDDILTAYHVIVEKSQVQLPLGKLDPTQQKIIDAIGWEPRHIDDIAVELNIPVSSLSALILTMQMDGYVKELAGKRYIRLAP
jgi:DNA processing protein